MKDEAITDYRKKARKTLVVLSTRFGSNFSGASYVTYQIAQRLCSSVHEVVIIAKELGAHDIPNLRFQQYRHWWSAIRYIQKNHSEHTVYYGDFYNAFLLIIAGVRFVFTYHDNWPEQGKLSSRSRLQWLFYWKIYQWIFSRATPTITVSQYKFNLIKPYTKDLHLILNGFKTPELPLENRPQHRKGILMVGTIDQRKYKFALDLFENLKRQSFNIPIDIYGSCHDKQLAKKLSQYSFVSLKGYCSPIPFSKYQLLLHTSFIENLPLVYCEAIYSKTPVIGFDVGGSSEVIQPHNGILIEPYKINSMQEALNKIIAGDILLTPSPKDVAAYNWDSLINAYSKILLN